MTIDPETVAFVQERDAALMSLDIATINAMATKHGLPQIPDTLVGWASIHKARTAIRSFPADEKQRSKDWLLKHGFTHLDNAP